MSGLEGGTPEPSTTHPAASTRSSCQTERDRVSADRHRVVPVTLSQSAPRREGLQQVRTSWSLRKDQAGTTPFFAITRSLASDLSSTSNSFPRKSSPSLREPRCWRQSLPPYANAATLLGWRARCPTGVRGEGN